jgi:hypothetical protein
MIRNYDVSLISVKSSSKLFLCFPDGWEFHVHQGREFLSTPSGSSKYLFVGEVQSSLVEIVLNKLSKLLTSTLPVYSYS